MSRNARVLCEGIYFGEGPRWRNGRLWFSDFFANAVKSVSPVGDVRVEFEVDDPPSGLGWMPDGSMLIVSMTRRRVLRRSPDGRISVHADLSGIATFHCNDMVVDSSGRAYVGNFGFDLHHELAARGPERLGRSRHRRACAHLSRGRRGRRRRRVALPERVRHHARRQDADRRRDAQRFPRRVRHRAGRSLGDRRVWASTFPRVPDGIRSTLRAQSGSPTLSRRNACASPRAAKYSR